MEADLHVKDKDWSDGYTSQGTLELQKARRKTWTRLFLTSFSRNQN